MDKKKLKVLVKELAKDVKSEKDLSALTSEIVKLTVETALKSEIEDHLGYSKNSPDGLNTGNSRNGFTPKTLKGVFGHLEMQTPRDRNGTFEPQFVKKGQTRLSHFDDQIMALYAKGMTTRDIVATFKEMYGAQVSHTLISKVTDSVIDQVHAWQNRPLDDVYLIIYLDCIVVKIRQDNHVINKAVYIALGINSEGHKELMGFSNEIILLILKNELIFFLSINLLLFSVILEVNLKIFFREKNFMKFIYRYWGY